MGILKGFDKHCQELGVLPFFRREFVIAAVELLQLGDEALVLFLCTNDRRKLARQQTAVALGIYLEYDIFHRFFQSSLLYSSCVIA